MTIFYFPGCKYSARSPESSARLTAYLAGRFGAVAAGCCSADHARPEHGDVALYQFAEPARNCDSHLHLQCVKCGKVIHLDCHFMDEINEHIEEHHGFSIICKGSILYGTCEKCRNEE